MLGRLACLVRRSHKPMCGGVCARCWQHIRWFNGRWWTA